MLLNRTRIKMCGITRVRDALAAVEAGADALGLVFYPPSPRAIELDQAADIIAALPPFVSTVGLFVNENPQTVSHIADQLGLQCLQFHGDESADYCSQFSRPFLKAIRVRQATDIDAALTTYAKASGLLLDAYKAGVPGGTGESFNWHWVPEHGRSKIVLAGGLGPANVGQAIQVARPFAVDVSSGIESEPGIKSAAAMQAFTAAVYTADEME